MKIRQNICAAAILTLSTTMSHAGAMQGLSMSSDLSSAAVASQSCQYIPPQAQLRETFENHIGNDGPGTSGPKKEIFRKDDNGEFRNEKGETILENIQNDPPH